MKAKPKPHTRPAKRAPIPAKLLRRAGDRHQRKAGAHWYTKGGRL